MPASSGVRTVADWLAFARANPAQANVGVPAPGSIPQFLVHLMSRQSGVPLTSVPYRGSAPLVQDLLGGQIGAGTTALGDFLEHHGSGRLRVIGVLDQRRSPALPDVPTFAEQGQRLAWEYWLGLFAPRGTPAATVERINQSVARALAAADVRERMQRIVFEPAHGTPAALAELVRAGTTYWEPVVRSSGWVPQ